MTEKLEEIIQEEVAKLPTEAQEAIRSLEWENIAEEIGKKYLLDEDEITDFQTETLLVLVGIEDGDYYAQNIEDEVGTTQEDAEKMADEVFKKIFVPINDQITENIKKGDKSKNTNWDQSVDFILSGGDYSTFIARTDEVYPLEEDTQETILPEFSIK